MWQALAAISKACAMISSSIFLFEWCTATYNAWWMKSEILAYDPSYCKTHYDVCLEIGIMECFTIFLGPLLFLKIPRLRTASFVQSIPSPHIPFRRRRPDCRLCTPPDVGNAAACCSRWAPACCVRFGRYKSRLDRCKSRPNPAVKSNLLKTPMNKP